MNESNRTKKSYTSIIAGCTPTKSYMIISEIVDENIVLQLIKEGYLEKEIAMGKRVIK